MSAGRESTQRPKERDAGQPGQNTQTKRQTKRESWRVVGASVRGASHEERDQPCQDAHYWRILPSGALIAAVADGAGSASLGEVGSELAASTSVNALAALVEPGLEMEIGPGLTDEAIGQHLMAAMETARAALVTEAESRVVNQRELATTLILLIATGNGIAVAQVGDGAAVVGDGQGSVEGLTQPQNGEYINETTFLTSPEALDTVQTGVWRGTTAQGAIFSDGIQMLCLKMPEGLPHPPFFNPLFSFVSEIEPQIEPEGCSHRADFEHTRDSDDLDTKQAKEHLRTFLLSPSVTSNTTDDRTLLLFSLVKQEPVGREMADRA